MSSLNEEVHILRTLAQAHAEASGKKHERLPEAEAREFLDIIAGERLDAVYQPIIDVARRGIYGYEALIRGPADSRFASPMQLFRAATALKVDCDFEMLCRKIVIRRFAELQLGHYLFVNVSPVLLLSREFQKGKTMEYLARYGLDPARIVIELTEHHKTHDYAVLNNALDYYRGLGFKVALDDMGSGYSGLRLWTELLPDFIKIDKHFIRDIQHDKIKQSFIRGLMEISAGSNCRIIAEGVEHREEFEFLSNAGVNYLQGYYFARPAQQPVELIDKALFDCGRPANLATGASHDNLKRISKTMPPIPDHTRVRDVLDQLQKNPEVNLLPIVREDKPVGLVERFVFLNTLMQSLYGLDLYGKMKIIDFLKEEPVLVDVGANLESASQAVTSKGTSLQAFIVTERGRYMGVATVLDLLHLITEQQICSARHANPLTLLPGVQPTNEAIDRLLYAGTPFSLAYFDLDNFKPFNDAYGYDAGDVVIKRLADALRRVYRKEFSLIGHIGGDDFVVVDMSGDAEANCRQVIAMLEAAIVDFYSPAHLEAGGMTGRDRLGNDCFFPLLSLSIGIVPVECTAGCCTHLQISDLATQAKKMAKQQDGNAVFVNRRQTGRGLVE